MELDDQFIWEVVIQNTNTKVLDTKTFDKVIMCGGTNHVPKKPSLLMEETFKGEIIHSSQFRGGESMKAKNVVVVGLGESGSDISYLISEQAEKTLLLSRKGESNHAFHEGVQKGPRNRKTAQ